jgi:hypothetical protein
MTTITLIVTLTVTLVVVFTTGVIAAGPREVMIKTFNENGES